MTTAVISLPGSGVYLPPPLEAVWRCYYSERLERWVLMNRRDGWLIECSVKQDAVTVALKCEALNRIYALYENG